MRTIIGGIVLVLLVGCGSDDDPVAVPDEQPIVASVTVLPSTAEFVVGDSIALTATVRSTTGAVLDDRPVTWSSGDAGIASVSTAGVVTGVAPGSADITAQVDGVSGRAAVVVGAPPLDFTSGRLTAGFSHTCALDPGGRAYCWGGNDEGQLGDGSTEDHLTPTPVAGGHLFTQISALAYHTCGLDESGQALCWGRNRHGQLGDGSTESRSVPTPVFGGMTFVRIAAGGNHSCGIAEGGGTYCWGSNRFGELGDGTTTPTSRPTAVVGGLSFAEVMAGVLHTCGLLEDGQAFCWGRNELRALGDGTNVHRSSPVRVAGPWLFRWLSAGWSHMCGLTEERGLCWGLGLHGQLGDGSSGDVAATPTPIQTAVSFARIAGGDRHTCGLDVDGRPYCWGVNDDGRLGDGSTVQRWVPVPVAGELELVEVAAGRFHTCGVDAQGAVSCWGDNASGQLGTGGTAGSTVPVTIGPVG